MSMAKPHVRFLLLFLCLADLGCIGCASIRDPPKTHILMANAQGEPIDPETYRPLRNGDYHAFDTYIDSMFGSIATYCKDRHPCHVLMYFHGGLNTRHASVSRAIKLTEKIHVEGKDIVYPIFVNWSSSLLGCWWDHLAHIHKGIWLGGETTAAAPYFAAIDEAKAISEAPLAWVAEFRHTFLPETGAAPSLAAYKELVQESKDDPVHSLRVNDLVDPAPPKGKVMIDNRRAWDLWGRRAALLPTAATKILSPPLLIQAAGTGAWNVLERRTAILFRTEAEFRGVRPETGAAAARERRKESVDSKEPAVQEARSLGKQYDTGATLAHFLTRYQQDFLPQFCKNHSYVPGPPSRVETSIPPDEEFSCEKEIDVTLVGHSMGTIVIDRLLRYAPGFKVKNIVFMASASTVDDYRDTIDPYLKLHQGDPNPPQMYHLILHPLAEVTERGYFDLPPRGSLLVWIDNYFTDPPTPQGRRVGRFTNLLPELSFADEEIRRQIHLKVFRVGGWLRCWNPQKHGDFGEFPFWDERYWRPETSTLEDSPIHRWDNKGCPKS